jgi:hypothetical protein
MSASRSKADATQTGYRIASCLNADVMDTLIRRVCESASILSVPPAENSRKISRLQSDENELVPPVGLEPTLP